MRRCISTLVGASIVSPATCGFDAVYGWRIPKNKERFSIRIKFKSICFGCAMHAPTDVLHPPASYSRIRPSVEIVTTCHGMNLPDAISARLTAFSSPPQHGTSMRRILTLLILLFAMICESFSA